MVEIIAQIPDNVNIDKIAMRKGLLKLGYNGQCPIKNIIYLYEQGKNAAKWCSTLIHELFHNVLHKVGIQSRHHHNIINTFEKGDENNGKL